MPAFAPRSWGIPAGPVGHHTGLPVEVTGLGYEIRKERSYRWNQDLHPPESGWVIQYTLSGRGRFAWAEPEVPEPADVPGGSLQGDRPPGLSPSGSRLPTLCPPVILGKGDLFFTSPGLGYDYAWAGHEAWEFMWIMVRGDWAGRILSRQTRSLSWRPVIGAGGTGEVAGLLESLLLRLDQGIPVDRRRLSLLAYEILLALESGVENLVAGGRGRGQAGQGQGLPGPDSAGSGYQDSEAPWPGGVTQAGTSQTGQPGLSAQAGLAGLSRQPGLSGPTAAMARQWLARHMDCQGPAGLAAHFGYHPKYFISWFRVRTGITPDRFIRDEKIRHACRLLEGTTRQIKAIAAELGFREDNHFSRVFRQSTGMSPQAWRTRRQSGQIYDGILVL